MEKLAVTQYPIHELIQRRWSPLAFSQQPVEPEKIASLLEAARWASSSFNEQPWLFLVATQAQTEDYQRLFSCLVEANQAWVKNAPVLMIGVAKLTFDHNSKPNAHAYYDLGAAVAQLTVQATASGLFVHQMAGFDTAKAREVCEIPTGYDPVVAIALGYYGDRQQLGEKLQEREASSRARKAFPNFVFTSHWQQPYPLP
ncbi:nitroreductase family protein [Synechococcus sp. PCC 6312]|uniref:nitroreductase family protein n=1 Tax=Synechococcus sp. (strain ATCC 27167 / PCC 6312) TaxID=195253 RepID=UPI00029F203A|nr:nitroreductase family protein [Synechococcus sp. PCC 6312]AFY59863.1 nitroreductase [Synechococcus sp. PCC 6312]